MQEGKRKTKQNAARHCENPELTERSQKKKKSKKVKDPSLEKFNKLKRELEEIEKNHDEGDLNTKVSILTFNSSGQKKNKFSTGYHERPSHLETEANVPRSKPTMPNTPALAETSKVLPSASNLKSPTLRKSQSPLRTQQKTSQKPLESSQVEDSAKVQEVKNGNDAVKSVSQPKLKKNSGNFESSSNTEAFDGGLQKSAVRKTESKIPPIDPELYQKLQKKHDLGNSNYQPFEMRQLEELRPKPTINQKSKNINQKLNRGQFENVHQRLFYKGIETIKQREELQNIQFGRVHTFRPMTGNPSPKAAMGKKDIDQLVYSYRDRDIMLGRMKHLNENYDKTDGKKLYVPRINKQVPVSHAYSLEEIEAWKTQSKEYLKKLRQIFDFLDRKGTGIVHASKIDYENIHPQMMNLLASIIEAVEDHQAPLTFGNFFDLIEDSNLTQNVVDIFDIINREPLINPKPLKHKNFTFAN